MVPTRSRGDSDESPSPVGKLGGDAIEVVLEPELAGAADGRRRQDGSRGPDQVAQSAEPRALVGTGAQVFGDRELFEELEGLERAPHPGAGAP